MIMARLYRLFILSKCSKLIFKSIISSHQFIVFYLFHSMPYKASSTIIIIYDLTSLFIIRTTLCLILGSFVALVPVSITVIVLLLGFSTIHLLVHSIDLCS